MKNRKSKILCFILMLSVILMVACTGEEVIVDTSADQASDASVDQVSDSSDLLPDNDMEPDYDIVFNQEEVLELTITISEDNWNLMKEDLDENISSGKSKPGQMSNSDYEPVWVEASVTFEDLTWEHVGVRYKGNSSLQSAVRANIEKLSFKLDFDEFEDIYPETEDQRFYGFKQLNLNNNYMDESLMREKVAGDLFSDFGLVSANTTFCAVYVDYGEGPEYFGLYTLVEEMDDTGVSQFADDSGNLYKPDGDAASFASGTYDEAEMEKKTNEDEADYSDVRALYDIINSDLRTSDLDEWKEELETVFNVDGFLKWLAANTVIQNWDTYGNMTHNYYLYSDPDTGQLNWIPWDNNEAFTDGKGNRGALSFEMDEVKDDWPLIYYLINDEEYRVIYDEYIEEFTSDIFTIDKMTSLYDEYYDLIKDYAYAEVDGYTFIGSDSDFDRAVENLKNHVAERNDLVDSYFNE